jgi:hypothetical protein
VASGWAYWPESVHVHARPAGTGTGAASSLQPGASPYDLVVEGPDGMPSPNAQLYASNPEYRRAWDARAQEHRSQWDGKGYWQGSDNDWIRQGIANRFQLPTQQTGGNTPAQQAPGQQAGTPPATATSISDMLKATPGYQFRFNEGLGALQATAAAQGGLNSGATMKAAQRYGQDYATGIYGDHMNRLAGLAGIGQTATTQTGQWGQNYAQTAGQNLINAGNQRAQSTYNRADAMSQGMGGIAGIFNNWYRQNSARNGGGTGWYLGNNPGVG